MTRFAIDALTAVRLAREGIKVSEEHRLVAPNVLRSDALALVSQEFRRGDLGADDARNILEGITTMRIRMLGDRVSRAAAWRLAVQLDWGDTRDAEYVAVAQLQADAFVTLNPDLVYRVDGLVTTAPFEILLP